MTPTQTITDAFKGFEITFIGDRAAEISSPGYPFGCYLGMVSEVGGKWVGTWNMVVNDRNHPYACNDPYTALRVFHLRAGTPGALEALAMLPGHG